jgi:hypothetical protein
MLNVAKICWKLFLTWPEPRRRWCAPGTYCHLMVRTGLFKNAAGLAHVPALGGSYLTQ